MKWFRHKSSAAMADKAAAGVAGSILKLQRRFAKFMESISGSWQRRQKIFFLAAVSLVFISFSIAAIISPFSGRRMSMPAVIETPLNISSGELTPRITEEEFQRIQRFKASLDSTTLKQRPELMDSLRMVEDLYYSK